jgi:hypothetical protein
MRKRIEIGLEKMLSTIGVVNKGVFIPLATHRQVATSRREGHGREGIHSGTYP